MTASNRFELKSPMPDMAILIIRRFPENALLIRNLILKNSNFRSICRDYAICNDAIQYWNQAKKPDTKAKVEEYRYLCKELENEVLQAFQPSQDSDDKPKQVNESLTSNQTVMDHSHKQPNRNHT